MNHSINSLPDWARKEFNNLSAKLLVAQTELELLKNQNKEEYSGLECMWLDRIDGKKYIDSREVNIAVPGIGKSYVTVSVEKDNVTVSACHRVSIMLSAANTFQFTTID